MQAPKDINHGLIANDGGGLIRRMDKRLDLTNRLLGEIKANEAARSLKQPERIDAVMARRFLEDADSFDLSTPPLIDDEAAEILSCSEEWLHLDGLTSLSDAAAAALARHQGLLSLHGLTSLSDTTAAALARHQGEALCLSSRTTMSGTAHATLDRFTNVVWDTLLGL